MATQLRRYTVASRDDLRSLIDWFPQLVPVREQYGFAIEFAYADFDNLQFVWAVSHAEDFAAAEAVYHVSPERTAAFEGFANPIQTMVVGMVESAI